MSQQRSELGNFSLGKQRLTVTGIIQYHSYTVGRYEDLAVKPSIVCSAVSGQKSLRRWTLDEWKARLGRWEE